DPCATGYSLRCYRILTTPLPFQSSKHSVDKAFTLLLACTLIRFAPIALRTYFVFPGNRSIVEHIFQESADNKGYSEDAYRASEYSTGT
ncbi:hypothetical protein, partial [Corynebacterium striatum]|uniref:hypothetical protein n=1 Tax=Corynebacterium striatum TaxID=43770 RepID=UPI0025516C85